MRDPKEESCKDRAQEDDPLSARETGVPSPMNGTDPANRGGRTSRIESEERPLVTFALLAYNQERFVREAVAGAFSQTYSPLEIILSDDCSTDRTFEIIKDMASQYRGPHTIILNRNEKNLRIGGHVNRVMELANGELVVAAAGDDVSLPQRTELTYKAWKDSGEAAWVVHGLANTIDVEGNFLGIWGNTAAKQLEDPLSYPRILPSATGCTEAWHRELFEYFGPLDSAVVNEDMAIPFRAALLGKRILFIEQPLINYRMHSNNIGIFPPQTLSRHALVNSHRQSSYRRLSVHRQWLADTIIAQPNNSKLIKDIRRGIAFQDFMHSISFGLSLDSFKKACIALKCGSGPVPVLKYIIKLSFPSFALHYLRLKEIINRNYPSPRSYSSRSH